MKIFYLFSCWLGILFNLCVTCSIADEVKVAVTKGFLETFEQVKPLFEQETGHSVVIFSDTSLAIYEKIKQGAAFDVFLSADMEYPTKLIRENFALPDSLFVYAMGRLVLWTKFSTISQISPEYLREIKQLSLANPKTSPYGHAAQQVLENLGIWQELQPNLVITEELIESYQHVVQKKVPVGFVLLAQYLSKVENLGTAYWIVPQSLYSPLFQGAVMLRSAENLLGAQMLLEFLRCPRASKIINDFGFKVNEQIDD